MSKTFIALQKASRANKRLITSPISTVEHPLIKSRREIDCLLPPMVAEEYRKLVNKITLSKRGRKIKTILVTGSVSGEGTTSIATNLALALSQRDGSKVLLIDANNRTPMVQDLFNLEIGNGLSDLCLGYTNLNKAIRRSFLPNMYVLTSGRRHSNPTILFSSSRFVRALEILREKFNHVVFDSPAINAFTDSITLAGHVDGVILVVGAESTRWEVAQKAKEQLQSTSAFLIGVVLNRRRYSIPTAVYKRL